MVVSVEICLQFENITWDITYNDLLLIYTPFYPREKLPVFYSKCDFSLDPQDYLTYVFQECEMGEYSERRSQNMEPFCQVVPIAGLEVIVSVVELNNCIVRLPWAYSGKWTTSRKTNLQF